MSKAEKVKKIGLFGCIANGIGAIIGAGIFGTLPEGINAIGPMVLPALIVAAIYIIANMFPNVYASSVIPTSGSFFLYSTKLMHPFFGLWMTLQGRLQPALIGTFAVMFAEYFVVSSPPPRAMRYSSASRCSSYSARSRTSATTPSPRSTTS